MLWSALSNVLAKLLTVISLRLAARESRLFLSPMLGVIPGEYVDESYIAKNYIHTRWRHPMLIRYDTQNTGV